MFDVCAATYDEGELSLGTKSHKGLVNKSIGDRDENYACLAFSSIIEKINVKGHNTPDFKIIGEWKYLRCRRMQDSSFRYT